MKNIIRFLLALVVGIFVAGFATNVVTVKASDNQNVVEIEDEAIPLSDGEADNGSGGMFLLMGGLLIIILTVVITVVSTFIVTAPIADEI